LQLYEIEELQNEPEEIKRLLQTFWAVFAGWSFSTGYTDCDMVENALNDL
jgi:hypothetical protein